MAKKKLNLDKLDIDKENIGLIQYNGTDKKVMWDFDTPTINDHCCARLRTTYNTYVACAPDDWCGYFHESNCAGPTLTVRP